MPGASSVPAPLFADGRPIPGTSYRVLRGRAGWPRRAEVEHVERGGRFVLEALPAAAGRFDMPRRLMNDWQRLAALAHPGIARVADAGVTPDGFAFCVLGELEGATLAERCASEGRLCAVEALDVAASVLSALGAAHGIGVVHGGVCPDNVLFDANGKAQLAGFGVAKLERAPAALGYAAPEQRAGRAFDRRADVYSAGLLLLEMLTGEQPANLDAASVASFVSRRAAGLPPELGALLGEVLEPDPHARPPSAARLAARLRRLAATLRMGAIADDAPTRHAGYDAPTAPGPACTAPPTDVDLRAPWLDAEAPVTRPDGLAARRGSVAARSPSAATPVASPPDTTTLVALPAALAPAPRDTVPQRVAEPARAAGISRRARVALAACVTLACCVLLVCPWLGKLGAFAAPSASAATRASAASRQPPPPTPSRGSTHADETLRPVLVLSRPAARRAPAPTAKAPRAAAEAKATARRAKPRWAPDIPPNPYLPGSGL